MLKYTITNEFNITIITFDSDPSYQDLVNLLDYLAKNNLYVKRLFDLSNAKFDLSAKEITTMADYGKAIFSKKNKGAVFTNSDLVFGESRQLSAYREDEHCLFKSFRNKQDAIDWLLDD